MYFSKLQFDPHTIALAHDAYTSHQLVWHAFPSERGRPRDFVFRHEQSSGRNPFTPHSHTGSVYYVVSQRPPDIPGDVGVAQIKPYEPKVRAGERFFFSLRANPVVSRREYEAGATDEPRRSKVKRHDVLMEAKLRAKADKIDPDSWAALQRRAVLTWFANQSARFGCSVDTDESFAVNGYRQHVLQRNGRDPIRFSSVDITGVIEAAEPDQLVQALFRGVGRSKGFGCGLLLLRRL